MQEIVSKLTWVDYAAFLAVLRGCYVGYRSGVFPEILRIVSYVVTILFAFLYKQDLAELITLNSFINQAAAEWISLGILLVAVFLVTKIISMVFLKAIKTSDGSLIVRLLGMCLGVVRWLFILSFAFMLIGYSPLEGLKADINERSVVGPRIAAIGPMMFDFLSNLSPKLALKQ